MEKHLQTKENKDVQQKPPNTLDLMRPISPFWPFISFRYSSRTLYCDGEKTHIKAREETLRNGRFTSEEFEGTTDKGVYEEMIQEMQRAFFKQMELFFKPFSIFLSGPENRKE